MTQAVPKTTGRTTPAAPPHASPLPQTIIPVYTELPARGERKGERVNVAHVDYYWTGTSWQAVEVNSVRPGTIGPEQMGPDIGHIDLEPNGWEAYLDENRIEKLTESLVIVNCLLERKSGGSTTIGTIEERFRPKEGTERRILAGILETTGGLYTKSTMVHISDAGSVAVETSPAESTFLQISGTMSIEA